MAGISVDPKKESQININPLTDEVLQNQLSLWNHLLSSCYGPFGKNVAIQNTIGGHVSITKASSRLLEAVKPSHPLIKQVIATVQNHLKNNVDFGLFTTVFVCELLEAYQKTNLPPMVKSIANEYFTKIILDHLSNNENNCCCLQLDVTSVIQLMATVKSILNSKLFISLSEDEINFLSSLVLESFYSLIPSKQSECKTVKLGKLHIMKCEGISLKYSKFIPGFLHPQPIFQTGVGDFKRLEVKIALFKVSLAGDMFENELKVEVNRQHAIKDYAFTKLLTLAEKLICLQVDVVACQKVIHPKICKFLQKNKIIVIQRLGERGFCILSAITGCVPIGTINAEGINENLFGTAESIESTIILEKRYFRIMGQAGTVLLCNSNEESLNELHVAFEQAVQCLFLLLKNPKVFIGGACLEIHLETVLINYVKKHSNNEKLLHLNKGQVTEALNAFTTALRKMTTILHKNKDLTLAKTPCFCGSCSSRIIGPSSVIDVSTCKLSAYKTSLETTSLLLKVGMCIIDRN